jgi:hypothetical protein
MTEAAVWLVRRSSGQLGVRLLFERPLTRKRIHRSLYARGSDG